MVGAFAAKLDQHGVINTGAEGIVYGLQIWLVAVCGELDAIGEATGQVLHKVARAISIATADLPVVDKLAVAIEHCPSPDATGAGIKAVGRLSHDKRWIVGSESSELWGGPATAAVGGSTEDSYDHADQKQYC